MNAVPRSNKPNKKLSTLHVFCDTKTQLLSDFSVASNLNALEIFTDTVQVAK